MSRQEERCGSIDDSRHSVVGEGSTVVELSNDPMPVPDEATMSTEFGR